MILETTGGAAAVRPKNMIQEVMKWKLLTINLIALKASK
jgi:hypothetical protein